LKEKRKIIMKNINLGCLRSYIVVVVVGEVQLLRICILLGSGSI
jgi:hypothetical protein